MDAPWRRALCINIEVVPLVSLETFYNERHVKGYDNKYSTHLEDSVSEALVKIVSDIDSRADYYDRRACIICKLLRSDKHQLFKRALLTFASTYPDTFLCNNKNCLDHPIMQAAQLSIRLQ